MPSSSAIFIAAGPDEYFVAGSGVSLKFSPNTPGPEFDGLATVEDGVFVDGRWVPGRRRNGDESDSDKALRLGGGVIPNGRIQRVKLYRYR